MLTSGDQPSQNQYFVVKPGITFYATRPRWFDSTVYVSSFKGALSCIFIISLNSQNIYLRRGKPTNNGLFLLTIAILVH